MSVVTVEDIKKEIEKVPAEKLETLYRYVRTLSSNQDKRLSRGEFFEKMRQIRIEGPPDFSRNLDDYLYHGKELD